MTAPLSTVVTAEIDYHVLAPRQITDPNGNRTQAAFGDLGRVTKTAVMGKVGSSDGDTLAAPTVTVGGVAAQSFRIRARQTPSCQ